MYRAIRCTAKIQSFSSTCFGTVSLFSIHTAGNSIFAEKLHDRQQPRQPGPPPIRVALTESAGRGVFATRRINAGDLIHTAKPLISLPSTTTANTVCYFCLRSVSDSQSQSYAFCSQHCRQQTNGFYEVEKKLESSAFDDYCRTEGLKYPLMVKRFACMVISGEAAPDSIHILQPASLSPQVIFKMEAEFSLLRSAFIKTGIMEERITFLTNQWYVGVLARIRINAFRVELAGGSYKDLLKSAAASVDSDAANGNAVYMLPSFYNHDCDPNAHIIWIDNTEARLKTLADIEAGEELRIRYIDASKERDARQVLLYEGFGFQCKCPRCLSGD